ncbi:MAG: sulfocyanin-like copper-binding protein [Dehalococcoidia bacterium]
MSRLHGGLPCAARAVVALAVAGVCAVLAGGCIQIKNSYDNATPLTLTEWAITGEDGAPLPEFRAGRVALRVHNAGKVPHEVILLRTSREPTALPMQVGRVDEKAAGAVYGAVHVPVSGDTQVAAFQLRAGTYVFLCNISGHYTSGMYATATVR